MVVPVGWWYIYKPKYIVHRNVACATDPEIRTVVGDRGWASVVQPCHKRYTSMLAISLGCCRLRWDAARSSRIFEQYSTAVPAVQRHVHTRASSTVRSTEEFAER